MGIMLQSKKLLYTFHEFNLIVARIQIIQYILIIISKRQNSSWIHRMLLTLSDTYYNKESYLELIAVECVHVKDYSIC